MPTKEVALMSPGDTPPIPPPGETVAAEESAREAEAAVALENIDRLLLTAPEGMVRPLASPADTAEEAEPQAAAAAGGRGEGAGKTLREAADETGVRVGPRIAAMETEPVLEKNAVGRTDEKQGGGMEEGVELGCVAGAGGGEMIIAVDNEERRAAEGAAEENEGAEGAEPVERGRRP